MTENDEKRGAQAAVFCADLHRHIALLDSQASTIAAKLRGDVDVSGPGQPSRGGSLHGKLTELSDERRRVMDLLASIGHSYPCSHG